MAVYEFVSHGVADTALLAERLASLFIPGTVITLDGELGAGKTTFSQGVAKAVGVTDIVNSPTFTIIKEYEGNLPFYHMDVYRLSVEEAEELGLDDYFYGEGVTLIEWASLIEELLPADRLSIVLEQDLDGARRFRLTPSGEPYRQWCMELKENGYLL